MISQASRDCSKTGTTRTHLNSAAQARLSAGFSLVEIMVGMVMGLLGMIVILQMMTLFEGQKRTTTGGDDAQNSAAISLHTLQQDLEQAGYGLTTLGLLNCNVSLGGPVTAIAPVIINPPAAIIPAGDANTDRLLISYGNSNSIAEGNLITGLAGTVYTVQLPSSFRLNDRVIAAANPPTPAANPCPGVLLIDRIAIAPVDGVKTVTVASGVAVTVKATLYNLGQSPQILAYAIRGGNLTVCDYTQNNCGNAALTGNTAVWLPIANNIVSLRAEYGHDDIATVGGTIVRTQPQINAITNSSTPPIPLPNYIVNKYDQTTPTTGCGWARTPAIRLVLVARGQFEKLAVTAAAPTWSGSSNLNGHVPVLIDLNTAQNQNWTNYRYKVLETVVPIRNITWMGVQAGC